MSEADASVEAGRPKERAPRVALRRPATQPLEAVATTAPAAAAAAGLPPRHPEPAASPAPAPSSLETRLADAEAGRERALSELRALADSVLRPGFRPPSAWAEREAAYRRDRASWQALAAEAAARVREL
jgi:hypothetical protein